MDAFDEAFGPFVTDRDKFQSQFTVLIHGLSTLEAVEKIKHQAALIDRTSDAVRRAHLRHKLQPLVSLLESRPAETVVAAVVLVGVGNVTEIPLRREWGATLREYDIPTFMFKYGEHFDIPYLRALFLDHTLYHVVHVHNNRLTHSLINTTKRRTVHTEETKGLDVAAYVAAAVPAGQTAVIHGVSGLLKPAEARTVAAGHTLVTRALRDEDVFDLFERAAAARVHRDLETWLAALTNPKLVHRLAFGADIRRHIQASQLQTLFCTPAVAAQLRAKVPADRLRTFEVREVQSFDGGDVGKRLERDFAGAVGVTYY